jgi:hypothetical protein
VNWVLGKKSSLKVMIVGVPHIGCTPKTNDFHPYDSVRTGRVTSALNSLNNKLATLANQKGVGYCSDVFDITKVLLTQDYFCLGGVPIWKNPPHEDGDPRYLFLGDGFHPGHACQAVFAQRILDAFNAKYGSSIPRITNTDILTSILGLRTDLPFDDWTKNHNLPDGERGVGDDWDADGVKNLVEYALDMNPTIKDQRLLPAPEITTVNGQLCVGITYKLRIQECSLFAVTPQQSSNLSSWTDVPSANIKTNADGSLSVRLPIIAGNPPIFLRLKARLLPAN